MNTIALQKDTDKSAMKTSRDHVLLAFGALLLLSGFVVSFHIQKTLPSSALMKPQVSVQPLNVYTVQLITYTQLNRAEQEAMRLSRLGFDAFVLEDGRFFKVCAGQFQDSDRAKQALTKIRSHFTHIYQDAFVRFVKGT